jgi:D-glycero-D-manno-heptose 1,7-bisphosphate phosphatase
MPSARLRRAIFLDRDGTLNVDTGYVSRPQDVHIVEGAAEGAKLLAEAGYMLVIVSNQSGIARGMMTQAQADSVDERLLALLAQRGVSVQATYRCPHLPTGSVAAFAMDCDCRKPKPGMILQAAREHGIDLAASWMIGDGARDVEAGLAAGCRAILLAPDGAGALAGPRVFAAKDLVAAAHLIASSAEHS